MNKFKIIAGVDKNNSLGNGYKLPWKVFSEDMNWFKKKTLNNTVVMGRKTYDSMNSIKLKDRMNIVLTSTPERYFNYKDTHTFVSNFDDATKLKRQNDLYVIGGADLYNQTITNPNCDEIFLTRVNTSCDYKHDSYSTCDYMKDKVDKKVYFPHLSAEDYYLSNIIEHGDCMIKRHDNCNIDTTYEILHYKRLLKETTNTYHGEKGYLNAIKDIMTKGIDRNDRTGVGTRSLFGLNFRYDLQLGFPLLTTKRMFSRGIFEELLWFLNGHTNVKLLQDNDVHIWDGNSSREYLDKIGLTSRKVGDAGPIYGHQFRHFGAKYVDCHTSYKGQGIDQLQYVIDLIKNDPESRRMIINLWNPVDLNAMALPPCHILYHFWISEGKYVHCSMLQRSGDMGLGVPFNIASASLLTHIIANLTGLVAKELVHTINDAHIYNNHIDALKTQLTLTARPFPKLRIIDRCQKSVEDFNSYDFVLHGYTPHPTIKMDMAV
jgi:dihydrofolate reductase / thymidylate synthase